MCSSSRPQTDRAGLEGRAALEGPAGPEDRADPVDRDAPGHTRKPASCGDATLGLARQPGGGGVGTPRTHLSLYRLSNL